MANASLVTTLNETLEELSNEEKTGQSSMASLESEVKTARDYLESAKDRELVAAHEDEDIKKKQRELISYQNSLPLNERTQAINDKINRLNAQQLQTFEKREEAKAGVRQCEEMFRLAELHFAVQKAKYENIQKRWQEIAAQIKRLQTN